MESIQYCSNTDSSDMLNLDASEFFNVKYERISDGQTFLKTLEEGLHADITMKANGGSVKAHRSVLASVSPVFHAMFKHQMWEQVNSTVELPDMSIKGLKFFLVLVYIVPDHTFAMNNFFGYSLTEHFEEIFEACCKYQVKRLQPIVTRYLRDNLYPENCWEYLRKCEEISGFCDVKDYKTSRNGPYAECRDYIVRLFKEVVEEKIQTDLENLRVCFEKLIRNSSFVGQTNNEYLLRN